VLGDEEGVAGWKGSARGAFTGRGHDHRSRACELPPDTRQEAISGQAGRLVEMLSREH
jgi:hypothetical protein